MTSEVGHDTGPIPWHDYLDVHGHSRRPPGPGPSTGTGSTASHVFSATTGLSEQDYRRPGWGPP